MPAENRPVILVRCHGVNAELIAFARALARDGRYVVAFAIDARAGVEAVEDFATIVTSPEIYAQAGLFCSHDVLWRCGDYALYAAQGAFPDAPHIWMIEYDVLIVRNDPLSFFVEIDNHSSHDFLATHFGPASPEWYWTSRLAAYYPEPQHCLFPLVRASKRALAHLEAKRKTLFADNAGVYKGNEGHWPNDESFCASELVQAGFACADFNDIEIVYEPDAFGVDSPRHPCECDSDGIYHPVRRGAAYVATARRVGMAWQPLAPQLLLDAESEAEVDGLIEEMVAGSLERLGDNPTRLFGEDSALGLLLQVHPPTRTLDPLAREMGRLRLPDCLDALRALARTRGWKTPPLLADLAFGKPAWQSSISAWSREAHHARDAEGANGGRDDQAYAFHTDDEQGPWWTVDLQRAHAIKEIHIANRSDELAERLRHFLIKASDDGSKWRVAYASEGSEALDPVAPIVFSPPLVCRLLRVELPHRGYLHFRRFQAFGSVLRGAPD